MIFEQPFSFSAIRLNFASSTADLSFQARNLFSEQIRWPLKNRKHKFVFHWKDFPVKIVVESANILEGCWFAKTSIIAK